MTDGNRIRESLARVNEVVTRTLGEVAGAFFCLTLYVKGHAVVNLSMYRGCHVPEEVDCLVRKVRFIELQSACQ